MPLRTPEPHITHHMRDAHRVGPFIQDRQREQWRLVWSGFRAPHYPGSRSLLPKLLALVLIMLIGGQMTRYGASQLPIRSTYSCIESNACGPCSNTSNASCINYDSSDDFCRGECMLRENWANPRCKGTCKIVGAETCFDICRRNEGCTNHFCITQTQAEQMEKGESCKQKGKLYYISVKRPEKYEFPATHEPFWPSVLTPQPQPLPNNDGDPYLWLYVSLGVLGFVAILVVVIICWVRSGSTEPQVVYSRSRQSNENMGANPRGSKNGSHIGHTQRMTASTMPLFDVSPGRKSKTPPLAKSIRSPISGHGSHF